MSGFISRKDRITQFRTKEREVKNILRVATPPGIGDSYWAVLKLKSMMKKGDHLGRPFDAVHMLIPDCEPRRAAAFLEKFDFIEKVSHVKINYMQREDIKPGGAYNYVPTQQYPSFFWYSEDGKQSPLYDNNNPKRHEQRALADRAIRQLEANPDLYSSLTPEELEQRLPGGLPPFASAHWWLCPNEHLELGKRLEDWLPQFEVDWNTHQHFQFPPEDTTYAKNLTSQGDYVVFYFGPEGGNTVSGHNRGEMWSPKDWVNLAKLIHSMGLKIICVGAEYDRSYANRIYLEAYKQKAYKGQVFRDSNESDLILEDHLGEWEIARTLAVCKQAKAVISYQSGIGIYSVYMGVPTAMWWRPYGNNCLPNPNRFVSFHNDMKTAWAPPDSFNKEDGLTEMLSTSQYLPMLYDNTCPELIAGWVNKACHLRLLKTPETQRLCPNCGGRGHYADDNDECASCDGTGTYVS